MGRATWRWVTDGGLETDLIFHHDVELPEFAAYPLVWSEHGRDLLRGYYEAYAGIAAAAGAGLRLETPTWRANTDWGARLGAGDIDVARTLARRPGAVVVVCPASSACIDDVARLASQAPIVAVLVGKGRRAAHVVRRSAEREGDGVEDRLRGAGARVAVVGVSEVERWFANGCVVV